MTVYGRPSTGTVRPTIAAVPAEAALPQPVAQHHDAGCCPAASSPASEGAAEQRRDAEDVEQVGGHLQRGNPLGPIAAAQRHAPAWAAPSPANERASRR